MANQPKKYKKFVATAATATLVASAIVPVASAASLSDISGNTHEEAITALVSDGIISGYQDGTFKPNKELTRSDVVKLLGKFLETKGYEASADYKTRPAFADLTTKTNEELLKYASLVKEAGVFVGSNGNLLAGDPITRENMAITLVRTVNTVYNISLEEYVATQDFKGDVTDLTQAKAEARTAISVLDFYDITNPAAPAFNPKGNTTRGQFASFLHKTITADYTAAGQEDQEASSVLPTAIAFEQTSIQGKYGETVTLKAKVTVAEGESTTNIPVKFDIFHEKLANDTTIVPQITATVKTDANGVATYTYTRSQGNTDNVNAYATGKPALKAAAKVYWDTTLAIKDVTEGTTLANGEQKVYQITGENNELVYVAFKENLNVAPEKAVRGVEFLGLNTTGDTATAKFAYEYTTGGYAVGVIRLDSTGKANLVLTGDDAAVTPIAFVNNPGTTPKYDATALQAVGSTATFAKESVFDLSIKAEGNQTASVYKDDTQTGGRDYVATLKNREGKALANAELLVTFNNETTTTRGDVKVFDADGEPVVSTTTDSVTFRIVTDKDGVAKFTVSHPDADAFVTPIAFIDNGTGTGSEPGKLDKKDLQVTGEITYFRTTRTADYRSELVVTNADDKEVTTFGSDTVAEFSYQLSDQNGKARSYGSDTPVQFTVRAGAQAVELVDAAGNAVLENGVAVVIPAYTSKTILNRTVVAGQTDISIFLKSNGSDVRVTATPTNSGLSGLTSVTKTATFLSGASTSYFTISDVVQTTETNPTSRDAASITLTFTEAVAATSIEATKTGGTRGTITTDAANNKVLYVGFGADPVSVGETVSISYKGKVYSFVYETNANGRNVFRAQ
ncbi:S-layer homology domain-containing protein [Solibacillus merdavium]|uniref:S-layer homology domain-containing protein n=1 Tax=Solibacillus merdavium TaxID=2762218 RepID=A0ABR8XKV9_9BACL|nr:S-layer homology domain-containing protein [Solibacillus merdavium]MBD8032575.1 S-layer homology domain-containing protein [Solibacillus merdavium]